MLTLLGYVAECWLLLLATTALTFCGAAWWNERHPVEYEVPSPEMAEYMAAGLTPDGWGDVTWDEVMPERIAG